MISMTYFITENISLHVNFKSVTFLEWTNFWLKISSRALEGIMSGLMNIRIPKDIMIKEFNERLKNA